MPFVVAALVLLGAVTLLNLALTLAVIRRLKAQSEASFASAPNLAPAPGPSADVQVGTVVPAFSVRDLSDGEVKNTPQNGTTLFAFFSVDCRACWMNLDRFLAYARSCGLPPEQMVSVVVGDASRKQDQIREIASVSRVVSEPTGGTVSSAFGVHVYPVYALVDTEGVLVHLSGFAELPQTVGV
ncbi:hypothetical protein DN069_20855 [Streptacidiphilus pinicola]|uniref:Thioredoxin domain-containing protein n=1 Tax=Streptacidiphilus pinicola TaxID=2219663 RepID=A0A2X0J0I4_9ACTN|nr:hypothetical protein [Streptacidiphilus pinicola]RAG83706.1 hypothetical protein DN069_20855 [Streptacidiphilus pinicola]